MAKALGGPMQVAPLVGIWVGIGRDQAATLPAVLSSIAASSTLLFRGGSCVIIYEIDDARDGRGAALDVVRPPFRLADGVDDEPGFGVLVVASDASGGHVGAGAKQDLEDAAMAAGECPRIKSPGSSLSSAHGLPSERQW